MKKRVVLVIAIVTILAMMSGLLVACNGAGGGRTPVYQGMSIHSYATRLDAAMADLDDLGDILEDLIEGDYDGRDDDIDIDDPFKDGTADSIEQEIKDTLEVQGATEDIYYAEPNADIYITIHIDNPDNYEIMSFTLNGKKYTNYMFERGSDMENIILKYNVGAVSGIQSYTIDAIKYIDGTTLKDVIINGNKTVKAGVHVDNQVRADVSNETITSNDIAFDVHVKDADHLLGENKLYAVLYNGTDIISKKELALGDNHIEFDSLETSTMYEYGIAGYYDDLSGSGAQFNIITKKAFYTKAVVLFKDIVVGQDNIKWNYLWDNSIESQTITSLKLYKGAEEQVLDAKATSIDQLLSNTEYRLVAEYANLGKTESISVTFKTHAKAVPTIDIIDATSDQTSISFNINEVDTDSVGNITKIELLHGNDAPIVAENVDVRKFTGLLSNNDYIIKVTYVYDLNDGTGVQTITKESNVKTLAKAVPTIDIIDTTSDQTSISFNINEVDTDSIGNITKIELLHGNDAPIVAENVDVRKFAGLLSNNSYIIKVTYAYDLNDGTGVQTITKESNVKTVAKAVPTIAFKDIISTKSTINGEYVVTDPDGINTIDKVELYKGETLAKASTDKSIAFDTLEYYTDYTIKVSYHYDLCDGTGVHNEVATYDVKTKPHVEITNVKVSNTSAVSEGETIYLQATFNATYGVQIHSIVVNGVEYDVLDTSSDTRMFVEILNNGQFAGGETPLTIEKVNATLGGEPYEIALNGNDSANVFINGKMSVLDFSYVDTAYQPIKWCYKNAKLYGYLKLSNATKYTIDSIKVSGTDIVPTKIDDETYYFDVNASNGMSNMTLEEVVYHNQYIEKRQPYNWAISVYRTEDDIAHHIKAADDLKNVNGSFYYVLDNDIDLDGIEWAGVPFAGVFEGNGHSIKNMSYVATVKNKSVSVGLFTDAKGFIDNLKMVGATIIIDIDADDGQKYSAAVGTINAGDQWNTNNVITNCMTDDTSYIRVTNKTHGGTTIGGISSGHSTIFNCTNYARIEGVDRIGGIVGYGGSRVVASVNYGDIIGSENHVGGIAGCSEIIDRCANYGNIICHNEGVGGLTGCGGAITNSVNYGTVQGNKDFTGGIIGESRALVENCLNLGNIDGRNNRIGGIIGYNEGPLNNCLNVGDSSGYGISGHLIGVATNCYTIDGKEYHQDSVLYCDITQVNTKTFYTETLGWSEDIWDFSTLDIENGKGPTLKNVGANIVAK